MKNIDVKKIIKKIIIHGIGLGALMCVVGLSLWFVNFKFVQPGMSKSVSYYQNDIYDSPAVKFDHGETVSASFTTHGSVYGVKVMFHNLGIPCEGNALVELVDTQSGEVLARTNVPTQHLINDLYTDIPFDEPYIVPAGDYNLTLRMTPEFVSPDADMKIWANSSTGEIAYGILTDMVDKDTINGWFRLICLVMLIGAAAVYTVCFILPLKKENVFIVCLLAASCLFTLALPPYSSPDEEGHINMAYRLCNEYFDGYSKEDLAEMTVQRRRVDYSKIFEDKDTSILTYEYIYENLFSKAENNEIKPVSDVWHVGDFDGVYLMGAIGIKLSHILNLGFVPSMYMGRFFNLLLFAVCAYLAVKITPVGKEAFMAAAFLPITVHLANSFSRDVFVISMGFIFTAYLLKLIFQDETYRWFQLLLLAVISVLLIPSKLIYSILCIGIILLSFEKIPLVNRIKVKVNPFVVAGALAALALAILAVLSVLTPDLVSHAIKAVTGSGQTFEELYEMNSDLATYNVAVMLANPVVTLRLLLNTVYVNGAYYVKSLAGGVLSYNSVLISDGFVFIILACLLIACFTTQTDKVQLETKHRVCFGFIAFLIFAAVIYLGISWTPVRYDTLYGIQGKYLLPVMPMLLLAIRGKRFVVNKEIFNPLCFTMALTNLFVALNAIAVIIQR